MTGVPVRIGPKRIEILFADETELAELLESLERLRESGRAEARP